MATVRNLAEYGPLDKKLTTPTRSNAGTPVASLTPAFNGEIVLDTTNRVLWQAVGTANTDWIPYVEAK